MILAVKLMLIAGNERHSPLILFMSVLFADGKYRLKFGIKTLVEQFKHFLFFRMMTPNKM